MAAIASQGFDQPSAVDDLNRHGLVERVYRSLTEVPQDWSVRVGLYAEYGEGKTSVACQIVDRSLADHHAIFYFSPWAAASAENMFKVFGEGLVDAIDQHVRRMANVKAGPGAIPATWAQQPEMPRNLKDVARRFGLKSKEAVGVVGAAAGWQGTLASLALSSFLKRLEIDEARIDELRRDLGGKRMIVVIDDLDRVKPEMIPDLLMAVREILDIPGFSFLLPCDINIVERSLKAQLAQDVDAQRFLEKIVDVPFYIDSPNRAAIEGLFRKTLAQHAPFVPSDAVATVVDLLPSNPRRLKGIVRRLAPLAPEANRHQPDDLDWALLIYLAMLAAESQRFFDSFLPQVSGLNIVALTLRVLSKNQPDELESQITKLFSDLKIADERRGRIMELCDQLDRHLEKHGRERLDYHVALYRQPHPLTQSETQGAASSIADAAALAGWVDAHAIGQSRTQSEMAWRLLHSAINYYADILERIEKLHLSAYRPPLQVEALQCLTLIELINANYTLDPSHPTLGGLLIFMKAPNRQHQTIADDIALRNREELIIASWWLGLLRSDYSAAATLPDHIDESLWPPLAAAGQAIIERRLGDRLASDQHISLQDLPAAERRLLLDPSNGAWATYLPGVFVSAATNPNIQLNAIALIIDFSRSLAGITDVAAFVRAAHPVVHIWTAAISTQLTPRAKHLCGAAIIKINAERSNAPALQPPP